MSSANYSPLHLEPSNDVSGKNSLMYSSTSSLSSIATTTSPACSGNMANVSWSIGIRNFDDLKNFNWISDSFQSTNLSPIIGAPPLSLASSPPRIAMMSTINPMVPLSLTSKPISDDIASKVSINPIKLSQSKPSMMTIATPNSNGSHNLMSTALNLKAGEIPSSCQTMPLNLHAAVSSSASIQPLNGLKNGLKGYNRFV